MGTINNHDHDDNVFCLPPGFRFSPSDEELVVHFLYRKAALLPSRHPNLIPDLHLSAYDPWELNGKALAGDNYQWYFYSQRTSSSNRVSTNGYWKPMGVDDEPIVANYSSKRFIGIKKCLIYHVGKAPTEIKTNWIMHEFRLLSDCSSTNSTSSSASCRSSRKKGNQKVDFNRWVLCKVFKQNGGDDDDNNEDDTNELSCLDEVFLSMDDLEEISLPR